MFQNLLAFITKIDLSATGNITQCKQLGGAVMSEIAFL